MKLGNLFERENNNYDLVRLLAAYMVIYAHSYAIAFTEGKMDIVLKWSSVTHMGELAVFIFFFLSGIFIFMSVSRSRSIFEYTVKRLTRIYPALFVCVLLSVLIGGIFTTLDITDYFKDSQTVKYFINNIKLIWNEHVLPGVYKNHATDAINGSLWSITLGARLYVVVGILGLFGVLKNRTLANITLTLLIVGLITSPNMIPLIGSNPDLLGLQVFPKYAVTFVMGGLLYYNSPDLVLEKKLLLVSFIAIFLLKETILFKSAITVFGVLLFFYLGGNKSMIQFRLPADISYGVYLYGWPSGQLIYEWFPTISTEFSCVLTMLLATGFAVFSWVIIEKPVIKMGKRVIESVRMNRNKYNNVVLSAALTHWCITFFSDELVFYDVGVKPYSRVMYVLSKIILIPILYKFWKGINQIFIEKNSDCIRKLKYFMVYFVPMFLMLVMVWPGIWMSDDLWILGSAKYFQPYFYQNFISSFYYIGSLMLIPFPTGVIIVQLIIISLIIASVMYDLASVLSSKWIIGVLYLSLFALPIVHHNLFPIRQVVVSYLEMFFLFKCSFFYMTKKELKTSDMVKLVIAAILLCTWRSEAIYYLLMTPIIFMVSLRNVVAQRKIVIMSVVMVVISLTLITIQSIGVNIERGNTYALTSMIESLPSLINGVDETKYEKEFAVIDKVVDVKILSENESGIAALWVDSAERVNDYSDEDFSQFKRVFIKLVVENPYVFVKDRLRVFLNTYDNLALSSELYSVNWPHVIEFLDNNKLVEPINAEFRAAVIKTLECRAQNNVYETTPCFKWFWNVWMPNLMIFSWMIYFLFKRKYVQVLILSASVIRTFITFLTAPATFFMYYFPSYVLGVLLFGVLITKIISYVNVKYRNKLYLFQN